MSTEFKTIDQLVELMESRGIATDADTATVLRRESYYAIINGYKNPFLDRGAMRSSADDVYISGTTFRQIYDLFLFDRRLRQAMFPSILAAEAVLTNAVTYAFCERHPDANAYLDRSNYASARDMLVPRSFRGNRAAAHQRDLDDLMRQLNEKLSPNRGGLKPYVRHYLERYGEVPLWVLQNDLTFGNKAHFYRLQKRGTQNAACKIVGEVSGSGTRITPHDLLKAFDVLVKFRNICAHDDRLYCASVMGTRFVDMLSQLAVVLPAEEVRTAAEALDSLLRELRGRLGEDLMRQVTHAMGIQD